MAWIMIADDDKSICSLLKDVLEQDGHQTRAFHNGDEALEYLKNKDNRVPDLMVVDVMMPELDGYTLNAMMQADARLKGIPVVVITAMRKLKPFFEPSRKVAAFLEKPLDIKAFRSTISSLLSRSA